MIHIVEDDSAVRDSLSMLLEGMGYDCLAYEDAETFFAKGPPEAEDLIILDLQLPRLSGLHILEWISALKNSPRVLVISGQPQNALIHHVQRFSHPIMRKPLRAEDLIQYVS